MGSLKKNTAKEGRGREEKRAKSKKRSEKETSSKTQRRGRQQSAKTTPRRASEAKSKKGSHGSRKKEVPQKDRGSQKEKTRRETKTKRPQENSRKHGKVHTKPKHGRKTTSTDDGHAPGKLSFSECSTQPFLSSVFQSSENRPAENVSIGNIQTTIVNGGARYQLDLNEMFSWLKQNNILVPSAVHDSIGESFPPAKPIETEEKVSESPLVTTVEEDEINNYLLDNASDAMITSPTVESMGMESDLVDTLPITVPEMERESQDVELGQMREEETGRR